MNNRSNANAKQVCAAILVVHTCSRGGRDFLCMYIYVSFLGSKGARKLRSKKHLSLTRHSCEIWTFLAVFLPDFACDMTASEVFSLSSFALIS